MTDEQNLANDLLTELTAEIVSAYVSNNSVPVVELPNVIASVFQSVSNLGKTTPEIEEVRKPPVPIKKTIAEDFLISLEDGKRYKSLKRHLTKQGLTPDEYRAKWGLPSDYPMVAPSYAVMRSQLAKASGLGRKPGQKRGKQKA